MKYEWLVHVDGELPDSETDAILEHLYQVVNGYGEERGVAVVTTLHDNDPLPYA